MARKNWDKIARKEFEQMESNWQDDWKDLHDRVTRRG